MRCPKCNSENCNIQVVNEAILKNKHHGLIWWCIIGFWWVPIKWIFLTLPALIVKIFKPKKHKIKNIQKTVYVCQSCGYHWDA